MTSTQSIIKLKKGKRASDLVSSRVQVGERRVEAEIDVIAVDLWDL